MYINNRKTLKCDEVLNVIYRMQDSYYQRFKEATDECDRQKNQEAIKALEKVKCELGISKMLSSYYKERRLQ